MSGMDMPYPPNLHLVTPSKSVPKSVRVGSAGSAGPAGPAGPASGRDSGNFQLPGLSHSYTDFRKQYSCH